MKSIRSYPHRKWAMWIGAFYQPGLACREKTSEKTSDRAPFACARFLPGIPWNDNLDES
jgi:hypothetical protein